MYKWLVVKRKIESTIMFPIILIGRALGKLAKKEDYAVYFFFPFHHIGGAEKIHFQIAQAFANKKCIIYFTRKSKPESLLNEFTKAGFVIKDVSKYTDNKFIYPINILFRGIIS